MSRVVDDRWLEHDGVPVRVVVERTVDDDVTYQVTITADHGGCGDLEIEAAVGWYDFALGRQDAITTHEAFDQLYIVKTSDEAAMRYWFGAREAEAVLTTAEPFALSVNAAEVRLHGSLPFRQYVSIESAGLHVAVYAVATLAGRGRRLAAEWRARLEPLGAVEAGPVWRTDREYALTVERGRTRIRVDFPWRLHPLRRHGLRTRLAMTWPDAGAAVIYPRSWSWRSRPRVARGRELELPRPWAGESRDVPVLAALPDLGASLTALAVDWVVVGDGQLAIGWDRIVDDRDRLAAAVTQLERWAERVAPSAGPYR